MGFDISGVNPKAEVGSYFRNNLYWWHSLWRYVCHYCDDILTPEQAGKGHWNDGVEIQVWQAELIAERLQPLLASGEPRELEKEWKEAYDLVPNVECPVCTGTGLTEELVTCGCCNGKGVFKDDALIADLSPFAESNVKAFADFCKDSGGFRIW
ncbi:hypothetical protein ES703_101680 [subsurface metagenome]